MLIYLSAIGSLLMLHHFFGKDGLFLFIILVIIIANIQTLKAIDLVGFNAPVAMGTILFTTSFLATDILTELYGRKQAQKAIWLGFIATLMMSIFMLLTLGTKVTSSASEGMNLHYLQAHDAIKFIFTPTPAIFMASLIAYLSSQYMDVAVFSWVKSKTNGRFLGLRTLLATLPSTVIDNTIFSLLAWKVFYPLSLDFRTFLITYLLGPSLLRVVITFANTPFIYLIRRPNQMFPNVAYVS